MMATQAFPNNQKLINDRHMASQQTAETTQAKASLSGRQLLIIAVACAVTITTRLVETPIANLSFMAALTLFCGTVLRRTPAMLLPLGVRLFTDVAVHYRTGYSFFESWPFDYTAYVLIFLLGRTVNHRRYDAVLLTTLSSVAVYFVLSNFGVWLMWPETYARSLAGLADCFVMAVPFAGGTLLGNVVAAPVFYAAWNANKQPVAQTTTTKPSLIVSDK